MRSVSEYREALRAISEYGPQDPDRMLVSAALDELAEAREHVRVLREDLELARTALEALAYHRCVKDDSRYHVCNCDCESTKGIVANALAALAATAKKGQTP